MKSDVIDGDRLANAQRRKIMELPYSHFGRNPQQGVGPIPSQNSGLASGLTPDTIVRIFK